MHSDIKMNICLKEAAEHLHFSAMYFCYIRFIFLSSGLSEFTIHFHERVIEFLILGSSTNKQQTNNVKNLHLKLFIHFAKYLIE